MFDEDFAWKDLQRFMWNKGKDSDSICWSFLVENWLKKQWILGYRFYCVLIITIQGIHHTRDTRKKKGVNEFNDQESIADGVS